MGPLWEVMLPRGATLDIVGPGPNPSNYQILASTWSGAHLFLAKKPDIPDPFGFWIVASGDGKRWLEEHGDGWLRFERTGKRE